MTKTFVVTDPRDYDGDPFDVAGRAVQQCVGLARILSGSLVSAKNMARNAEMERALQQSDDPKAELWESSPQGRMFTDLIEVTQETEKRLTKLQQAASFNPKRPPKG